MIFFRGTFTTLHIVVRASEPLALLDTGVVEDFYGVDDQLSLLHLETKRRFDLLVTPVDGGLEGFLPLNTLPNGVYEVQGRMRDALGNATVFNAVETPAGNEAVVPLRVSVLPGTPRTPVLRRGPLIIIGGLSLDLPLVAARLVQRPSLRLEPTELPLSLREPANGRTNWSV